MSKNTNVKEVHAHSETDVHVERTTPQGTQFDGLTRGHENRDANVKMILVCFGVLFTYSLVATAIIGGIFFGVTKRDSAKDTVPSSTFKSLIAEAPLSRGGRLLQNESADKYLPTPTQQPPLMPDPHQPMVVLRHAEDHEVNSDGYIVNDKGDRVGVHIPVKQAMLLALKQGFPVETTASPLRPPAPVSPALQVAEDKGK